MRAPQSLLAASLALTAACTQGDGPPRAPELGTGDHSPDSVVFTTIATAADGLKQPRDLAFNPRRPEELWIVNHDDHSVVIVFDAPHDTRSHEKRIDGYAIHFMEFPTAIAFGQDPTTFEIPGTFATCGESRNSYDGQLPGGNDFMGPVLWSSDLSIFAAMNPHGLGSHLDMLHNTPLCMGIAHEDENRYWVFGGLSGSIYRYDFVIDDGIGNDDHGDGLTWRYARGEFARAPGVPSGIVYDPSSSSVYVSDSGNRRVARLDALSGTEGRLEPRPETPVQVMEDAIVEDVITEAQGLVTPSGIALHGDVLFVADHGGSRLLAYDLRGNLLNHLETGLPGGSLGGIAFGPDGRLYFVDIRGDRVVRVDPLDSPASDI